MTGQRRVSLQYLLPVLIITLLLVLVGAGSFLAYQEVRRYAMVAGAERLDRVSTQLSSVLARSTQRTIDQQTAVAERPVVLRAIDSREPSPELVEALEDLSSNDLPVELWDTAGGVITSVGAFPSGWDEARRATARSRARTESASFGPIWLLEADPYLWVTVPVRDSLGRRRGTLARMGGFQNAAAEQINALVGSVVRIYLSNVDGGPWISLNGGVRRVPGGVQAFERVARFDDESGETFLARSSPIGEEPIAVVAESQEAAILARPEAFLRRMEFGAALLLLAGAAAAWLLSRRITRPLRALSKAAADLAEGDYTRRARRESNDELGDLADAFNHMASEVERAHAELRNQYAAARDLAVRLEASNQRIVEAMLAADEARAAAERASLVKSDFLATMSHEIRTPINAIVGYADLLRLQISGPLNEEQRAQLERLSRSSRHLLRLVDEVLDLASAESGELQLASREANPADTIRAAFNRIATDAAEKGLRVSLPEEDGNDIHYHGDPRRAQQVLVNLLSNAVKFTPSGGDVRVSLAYDPADDPGGPGWVDFIVDDTGIGIEPSRQEMIFDPFVQVDSGLTRTHGGAGLGLALSQRLARMMGGEVTVKSEPGRGSRFTFRLPLARAGAAESA